MPVFAGASSPGIAAGSVQAGTAYNGPPNARRLSNGLVRIVGQISGSSFAVDFWDGVAWRAKAINVWLGATALTFDKLSIVDYRPESATLQYEYTVPTGGRVTVDVTLRRGMRVAIFQMSHNQVADIKASPFPTEAMTKTSERQLSDTADAQGHSLLMGAPRTYTQTPSTGLMTRTATQTFTFYVGLQLSAAGAGDLAADLSYQAIGVLSERVRPQRR